MGNRDRILIMKYVKNCTVSGSTIDSATNLSVIGHFQAVEDAVTELMGELKIDGITTQKLYHAIWVFAKNRLKLIKLLHWGEAFTVESFISSTSRVRLNVETEIRNAAGELCAYSGVELCAIDCDTGRIRKVSTVGVEESMAEGASGREIKFAKYSLDDLRAVDSVKVRSTNIDFCHHTNNVEYIRFLMNTYSVREMEEKQFKEIEICYAKQSFENDELQIYKRSDEGKDILVIKKDDDIVVKSEIVF